jgi:formylglycine-generating enzyme required for sulfatase activity
MKSSISIVLCIFVLFLCSMYVCSLQAQAQTDAGTLLSVGKHGIVDSEGKVSFLVTKDFKVKKRGADAGDSISFRMVRIDSGTFTMGQSGVNEYGTPRVEYGPVTVSVGNYWMCNTEVTQGLWESVMDTSFVGAIDDLSTNYGRGSDYPVYYMSWYDAIIFCNRLSVLLDMTPVYGDSGTDAAHKESITKLGYPKTSVPTIDSVKIDYNATGVRLPTEAEWEYAARGGAGVGTYYSGTDNPDHGSGSDVKTGVLGAYAWFQENNSGSSGSATYGAKAVGTKLPNVLGLFDMSGNIFEWCNDWYDTEGDASGIGANEFPGVGPTGASAGLNRVGRGGFWNSPAMFCPASNRRFQSPGNRPYSIGFRVVCSGF